MITLDIRNVNEGWAAAKNLLNGQHIVRPSRYGEVIEYPEPMLVKYQCPWERVLFDPVRNCNPWLHLFESLWVLAGRNDVAFISQFSKRMVEFSDDGETWHDAYGYRMRQWFLRDQIQEAIRLLKASHDERRAVLQMWDCIADLGRDGKAFPCNTHLYLKIREGCLTLTICCRSNDLVWGAMGSNSVCFSMLQEYLAAMIGVPVGPMYQLSDSWHAYTAVWEKYGGKQDTSYPDPYATCKVSRYALIRDAVSWNEDLRGFMYWVDNPEEEVHFDEPFFHDVAVPLYFAWQAYKNNSLQAASDHIGQCEASDWRLAAAEWLGRLAARRNRGEHNAAK